MSSIKLFLFKGTRDSINILLADCASILNGQETSDQARKKLEKQCNDLISQLRTLKRFKYKDGEPQAKVARKSSAIGLTTSRPLEIDFELRREILDLLQKNLDCSIEYLDEFSEDFKLDLIDENEELIGKLKQLRDVWYTSYEPLDRTSSSSSSSFTSRGWFGF